MVETRIDQELPDEHQPLLPTIAPNTGSSITETGPELEFQPGDQSNPREWSQRFRWAIVTILAYMAAVVTFTCIGVVPIAGNIVDELEGHHASPTTSALLVTIWELGEAAGPLLIAPLSEVFGRYPVMNGCSILFVVATSLTAVSKSTKLLIAARWFTGLAVATNVLNPSIIGDIFEPEQRGSAMSLISLAPLFGGAIGPAIAGVIAQTLGWRYVLFMATGLAVIAEMLILIFFRETYKNVILQKQLTARRTPKTENQTADDQKKKENMIKIWKAMTKPFAVLSGSMVLILLSIQAGIGFSFFYVMSVSLPTILQGKYGFNRAETGLAFIIFNVGSLFGVFLCNQTIDRLYIRLRGSDQGAGKPEYRLPIAILGAVLEVPAILAYGWIAELRLSPVLLLTSVAFLDFAILVNIIPVQAYVVDAYGMYSASAMTGVIVTRCLMGTFLPLATGPLALWLGYGWGFSVLAAIAALAAIIPILLFRYGAEWRQKSVYTRDA